MERVKMLKKLHSIKAISTNFVATYDMGLQFDVMTGEGVTTNIGNVGSWPYLRIPITKGIKKIQERIVNGEDVVSGDILKEEILKRLLTYWNICTGDTWMVEDRIIEKCVANLKKELLKIEGYYDCYFYINLEDWGDGEVILFKCYNDMCKHFAENFGSSVNLYDDMDDDKLACAYAEAEESEWKGIYFRDLTKSRLGAIDEQIIREKIKTLDRSLIKEKCQFLEKAVHDYGYTYAKSWYSDYPDEVELVLMDQEELGILDIYDAVGEIICTDTYLELLDDLDESVYTDELGYLEFKQLLIDMDYDILAGQFLEGEEDAVKAKYGEDGFVKLYF